tara:strand:- start:3223 stop:3522 length:300 start_codon:yes stop_codon:yes gene_type:complete
MAGRWFLDSHVPKCETLVRLIFRSSDKPVLGALNMSVYSKAGFFVLRPFFGRFSREKIGKNGKNPLDSVFLCTLLVPPCLFCAQRAGIWFNFCSKVITN